MANTTHFKSRLSNCKVIFTFLILICYIDCIVYSRSMPYEHDVYWNAVFKEFCLYIFMVLYILMGLCFF